MIPIDAAVVGSLLLMVGSASVAYWRGYHHGQEDYREAMKSR
jgi:uncharacterized membrane protein YfcA